MNEEIMIIKVSHGTVDNDGLNYDDLCVYPKVDQLEAYKIPKYEIFGGTRNSMAHLMRYCDQMARIVRNKALPMSRPDLRIMMAPTNSH